METVRGVGTGETRLAPSIGVVLAGVALVAALLPWTDQQLLVTVPGIEGSAAGAALGLAAVLVFVARRHGLLDRTVGGAVAGVTTVAVTGLAVYRLVVPGLGGGAAPAVGLGLPIAALAGLFAAALAYADLRALPDDRVVAKFRGTAAALGIGFLGYALSFVVAQVPAALVRPLGITVSVAVLTAGSGIGLALFAVGYLRYRDLDTDYLDVGWPDLRVVAYGIGGLLVLFVASAGVSSLFQFLGLPSAESSIQQLAERVDNPEFLLVLVPLSFLAIGPGEELVYRNVVQKYLYEWFSKPTAVVVASAVFGVIHFQQYADPNPIATLSTLFVVFVLSLVLGVTYYKTENLLAPIFIHGTFNAVQFAALYVQLTGGQSPV